MSSQSHASGRSQHSNLLGHQLHRIATLILSASAGILSVCPGNAGLHAESRSVPNIVFILADDLGRGDYSAFGTKDIRTPNIDRLCREGITLDNFYANSCVCSPTRAALLTGCFPDRVGVPGVIRHTPENSWGHLAAGRSPR